MSAPVTASMPAAAPAPAKPRRRPDFLRLVRPGERTPAQRRRRARLAAVFTVFVAGAGLFSVAAFHVVLTQNQFRLDQLRSRAGTEQARYQRLRLKVAELESPDRIVATAQSRLGMVQAPSIVFLAPVQPAPGVDDGGVGPVQARGGWSTVKPELAARP